jgi:hypothetical protein
MRSLARPADKEEILHRLRDLRPESARRWGRMSVHQMVCHLGDAFRIVTSEKTVADASSLPYRTVVKWVALYAPMRWPPDIRTSPELDQAEGRGTRPADFANDLDDVRALVERITREAGTVAWPRHPLFGGMTVGDWLRWGYLHVDHHLRQFGA